MDRLTPQQRLQIVEVYYQNQSSVRQTYRALRAFYHHNRPSEQSIRRTINKFGSQFTLLDATSTPTRQKTVRSESNIAAVEASVAKYPNMSIRQRAQELGLCPSTTWKIMRKDLRAQSSKSHLNSIQNNKVATPNPTGKAKADTDSDADKADSKLVICEDKEQQEI